MWGLIPGICENTYPVHDSSCQLVLVAVPPKAIIEAYVPESRTRNALLAQRFQKLRPVVFLADGVQKGRDRPRIRSAVECLWMKLTVSAVIIRVDTPYVTTVILNEAKVKIVH